MARNQVWGVFAHKDIYICIHTFVDARVLSRINVKGSQSPPEPYSRHSGPFTTALLPRFVYPRCTDGFKFEPALRALCDGTVAWSLFQYTLHRAIGPDRIMKHNARSAGPYKHNALNPIAHNPL